MSSPEKLFITGGTGYIGGSVLNGIVKKFPALQVTALVRSEPAGFKNDYPTVSTVLGDFDSFDVIKAASQDADIIIHAGDNNHQGCVNGILAGISARATPTFLIHLTGTGCISDRMNNTWEGELNPRVWSDFNDIKEINNRPEGAFHRIVDQQIYAADNELIKTAFVCPPDIYGQQTGPRKRATFMVPLYVKVLLEKKEAFYLGAGENMRAVTHITDVVDAFCILVDNALRGGGEAQWGLDGFYFAVSSEVRWKDAAEAIHAIGVRDGWLPKDAKLVSYDRAQIEGLAKGREEAVLYLWGSNSRAQSERISELGWSPSGPTFWESLEEDVRIAVTDAKKSNELPSSLPTVN